MSGYRSPSMTSHGRATGLLVGRWGGAATGAFWAGGTVSRRGASVLGAIERRDVAGRTRNTPVSSSSSR